MLHPLGLPNQLASINRTLVMGVLNVTPDSFSDGGLFATSSTAIEHGVSMASAGADIVDIGGESTRPGAERITAQQELDRVIPVVEELTRRGIATSIDSMRAEVAREAVKAGACIVNDVSGGKADEDMFSTVAALEVPYIAMHWRGHSTVMTQLTDYDNVVSDVRNEIEEQIEAAIKAGIKRERIVVDPGIGFAKTTDQNWPVLANLEVLEELGLPLLIGVSRKKFIGELLADSSGALRDMSGREAATTAITTLVAQRPVWAVRVHDVQSSHDAIQVVERMRVSRA